MCRVQHTNKNSRTFGVSAGKRDQIEFFFKKNFLSKIDVDLIIWSRIFVISKKIFLSIWSLFPALTPFGNIEGYDEEFYSPSVRYSLPKEEYNHLIKFYKGRNINGNVRLFYFVLFVLI